MNKLIQLLMIVLLLVSTSQKTQVSNLIKSNSLQKEVIPNGWVRIVNQLDHFCLYRGLNYMSRHQEACDSLDARGNWKITPNADGSYYLLNQHANEYFNLKWTSQYVSDYTKSPRKILLVYLKQYPQVFSIRPSENQNLCYVGKYGKFEKCVEEDQSQLFYIDSTVTDTPIIPNIYYLLSWETSDKTTTLCQTDALGTADMWDCSYSSPNHAFKFVPIEDGSNTYQLINGLGLALQYFPYNKETPGPGPVYPKPSNSSDPYQRWRAVRSQKNPTKVFIKIPSVGICLFFKSNANVCPDSDEYNYLLSLNVPCADELVFPETWYLFRWGYKDCSSVDTLGNIKNENCQLTDRFLFRFEINSQNKKYYIYNKALGDKKVLSIPLTYDGKRDYSNYSVVFTDKRADGHHSQLWNTTKRNKQISLSFELLNDWSGAVLVVNYQGGGAWWNVNNQLIPQATDFKYYLNGPLASVTETQQEILGLPKYKPSKCTARWLYQFN